MRGVQQVGGRLCSLPPSPPSSTLSGSGDGSSMPSSTSSTIRLLDDVPRMSLRAPTPVLVDGSSSSSISRVGRAVLGARRGRDVLCTVVSSSSSACSTRACPRVGTCSSMRPSVGIMRTRVPRVVAVASFAVVGSSSPCEGSSVCPRLARRLARSPATSSLVLGLPVVTSSSKSSPTTLGGGMGAANSVHTHAWHTICACRLQAFAPSGEFY